MNNVEMKILMEKDNEIAIEKIKENGLDEMEVLFFTDIAFSSAMVGFDTEGRLIYDYDLMVEHLINYYDFDIPKAIFYIETIIIEFLEKCQDSLKPIILCSFDK